MMTEGGSGRATSRGRRSLPVASGGWWSRMTRSESPQTDRAAAAVSATVICWYPPTWSSLVTSATIAGASSTRSTRRVARSATTVVEEDQRLPAGHDRLEGAVHPGVEDRANQVTEPLDGQLGDHFLLVGPRGGQGVVDLHRPDDPATHRDLVASQPVGVSLAVQAL